MCKVVYYFKNIIFISFQHYYILISSPFMFLECDFHFPYAKEKIKLRYHHCRSISTADLVFLSTHALARHQHDLVPLMSAGVQ